MCGCVCEREIETTKENKSEGKREENLAHVYHQSSHTNEIQKKKKENQKVEVCM